MGLWLFRLLDYFTDYYYGYKDYEIKLMRKNLQKKAEIEYGLNI